MANRSRKATKTQKFALPRAGGKKGSRGPAVRRFPATPVAKPQPTKEEKIAALMREWSMNRLRTVGLVPERLLNPDDLVGAKGLRVYRQMLADDQVKAALALKKQVVLSTGWDVEPADDSAQATEHAKFVVENFEQMDGTLDDDLKEVLSALEFGFSISEICYQPIETGDYAGKIGLKALKTRLPYDFLFRVDQHDNLMPMGIEQFGKPLPAEKFVIYSHDKSFDNWYGSSDLRAAYRCYSDDTRVLTKNGWKFFQDVQLQDELASLDPETGRMEYRKPTKVFHYWYKGKMFHQGGRFIDLLVTPNHRMWVAKGLRQPYKFEFAEARDLPKIVRYKCNADWRGEEREWFELPAIMIRQRMSDRFGTDHRLRETARPAMQIRMDDWLRFFGIWLAEGWTTKTRQSVVGLCQKEGPKARLIAGWIAACGFHAGERTTPEGLVRFEITNKQLYTYLAPFGKSHNKFIPRELLELPPRQLRILYDAMMLGDGSQHGYATVSDRLADDLMELILKAGGAPNRRKDSSGNRFGPDGTVWTIHWNTRNIGATVCNEHADHRSEMEYVGDVWCVDVPPHHLVYVERNGKACWSGNSWWFKDSVTKWWAIFLERFGMPFAEGIYKRGGLVDPTAFDALKAILNNLAASTSLLHSDEVELKFPAAGTAQGSSIYDLAIQSADQGIARAILVPNLLGVSPQGRRGSYGQARQQFDVFILVVERIQRELQEHVVGEQIIRRLIDLNYSNVKAYPNFVFLPFTESDKAQLLTLWYQALNAQAVTSRPEDEAHIRSVTEFPEVSIQDLQAEAEARKAQQAAIAAAGGVPPDGTAPKPGGKPNGGGGDGQPSEKQVTDTIDGVLQKLSQHELVETVGQTLRMYGFADGEMPTEDEVAAVLARLEQTYPSLSEAGLVSAAVDELIAGAGDGIDENELQTLVEEVFSSKDYVQEETA